MIRRIHVTYHLETAPDASSETIERVHEMHKDGCPVYRSIYKAIEITTSLAARV